MIKSSGKTHAILKDDHRKMNHSCFFNGLKHIGTVLLSWTSVIVCTHKRDDMITDQPTEYTSSRVISLDHPVPLSACYLKVGLDTF